MSKPRGWIDAAANGTLRVSVDLEPHLQPSTIWKIPSLPGILLWKDVRSIFHTDDSRGLDLPFQSFNTRLTQTWSVPTFPVLAG